MSPNTGPNAVRFVDTLALRRAGRMLVALSLSFVAGVAAAFDAGRSPVLPAVGTIEVVFSPWRDAEARIIDVIRDARHELYVQAFLFTSRPISEALIDAHRRGVAVEVLADHDMNAKGDRSQLPKLVAAGISVAVETRYASAHNKVILADPLREGGAIITGSFNFTYSARMKNAENVLILRNNPTLARSYLDNWQRHRREATPWNERTRAGAPEKTPETP